MTDSLRARLLERLRMADMDETCELCKALIEDVVSLREALGTLKVAVNDKVEDKGATAFCERALAASDERLKRALGEGE